MSDTPRTDESRGYYGYDDACPAYDMQKIERELAATTSQLARICQEGFGNDDTIGLEPADDYVLRKLAEWQDGLKVNCSEALAQVFNAIRRRLAASQAGQAKWQALAEGLAGAAADYMTKCPADADETPSFYAAGLGLSQALAAYEAAKAGGAAAGADGLAVDSVALAKALLETRDIQVYGDGCSTQERDTWILAKMIDTALATKSGNLPDPLAEAVKHCDWKEDEDGNWYTACHQFMSFEHAPPNEQGYTFCHRCGHPINFIEFAPPLDEPPGPA